MRCWPWNMKKAFGIATDWINCFYDFFCVNLVRLRLISLIKENGTILGLDQILLDEMHETSILCKLWEVEISALNKKREIEDIYFIQIKRNRFFNRNKRLIFANREKLRDPLCRLGENPGTVGFRLKKLARSVWSRDRWDKKN